MVPPPAGRHHRTTEAATLNLRRLLAPFADQPEHSVVIVDFDGSLSPVVDDPAQAAPLPAAEEGLTRLAACLGRVAVVSGRPASFLRAALPIEGLVLVGQYGLEHFEDGRVVSHPAALAHTAAVEAAARAAERELPGITVERKGVAVTLHWRAAPNLADAAQALGRRLAGIHGLAVQPARLALELRPPLPCDKGTVVRRLARGWHAALVAGDDYGDIAMFAAVGDLLETGELAHGVRVALRSPETPPGLLESADHSLDGPAGLAALLEAVADAASGAPDRFRRDFPG